MTDLDVKWGLIITFIKLFEPNMVQLNEKNSRGGAHWSVHTKCKFVGLCDWARKNE